MANEKPDFSSIPSFKELKRNIEQGYKKLIGESEKLATARAKATLTKEGALAVLSKDAITATENLKRSLKNIEREASAGYRPGIWSVIGEFTFQYEITKDDVYADENWSALFKELTLSGFPEIKVDMYSQVCNETGFGFVVENINGATRLVFSLGYYDLVK